jgi:predicted Zn-dependent protease
VTAVELAQRAVAVAAPNALALVTHERSLMLRFAAGRPTQATAIDDFTLDIAVPLDGHVGRASTNAADDAAIADCAERARLAAAAAAVTGEGGFPGFSPHRESPTPARPDAPSGRPAREPFDPATGDLDPATGAAALEAAFSVAADHGVEAHGIWTVAEQEQAWALAGEAGQDERRTDAFMKVICIAPNGRSGYAASSSVAVADLDASALAERAALKATAGGEPAEVPPGEYPVVFEADAVGWLCDLLAGCAFNGLAHAEGRGALDGKLGETVAAPTINLTDSPGHALTLPRSFDAEGTPKAPVPLIQGGVAHGVAHDLRSAALAGNGAVTTGHALAPGGDASGPHPTNLVLAAGGAADEAELCAPIERGVYVTRLWYANVVRPKETLITAVTRDGTFLIEDGRVTRPLRDLRLTDGVLRILSGTSALSRERKLASDGEFYGRRFAYGVVCPAIRADAVRFTGASG